MKKINSTRIVYWPNDIVRSNLHEYASFRDDLVLEERKVASTIACAMIGIFRKLPTKLTPDFTDDLLQVRRNINSFEEELQLATDRKSTKKVLKQYSLEYEDIYLAKQNLTQELAQECIEHCFEKFREDVRNYKFIALSRKNFIPRIDEGERESDSDEESSTKWQDRVSSKSTSQTSSLSSLGSEDLNNSGGAIK